MADALIELIEHSVDKKMQNSDYLMAIPAKVKEPLSNGMYVVNVLANDTQLIVPNWSGTELDVGDNVHLFYKGNTLSERTAYIGASLFKPEGANRNKIKYVVGSNSLGVVGNTQFTICQIEWESVQKQNVFISFNANVTGNTTGINTLYIYMDETLHEFQPKMTLNENQCYIQNFLLPFEASVGKHVVEIKAMGCGDYTDIYGFVFGQGLRDESNAFDPTNENDYIYTGGTILYYIGSSKRPEIPTTLDGVPVNELELTAFNDTKVEAVKIPEGVTIIR